LPFSICFYADLRLSREPILTSSDFYPGAGQVPEGNFADCLLILPSSLGAKSKDNRQTNFACEICPAPQTTIKSFWGDFFQKGALVL